MNNPFFDIVFVVLVYKNTKVLKDFFKGLNISYSHKVVVVNSFYDKDSEYECQSIAEEYDADFISIANLGYSYGNNVGCNHAINNYKFKFLIIANSDTVIKEISCLQLINEEKAVIAPDTKMLTGKRQNPNIPFESYIYLRFLNLYYQYKYPLFITIAHAVNRLYREIVLFYSRLFNLKSFKIFSPHGSFIIFTHKAVMELMPIFNEKMFLYNEELHLAYNCKLHNIPIYYAKDIKILHLEGASSSKESNSWKNHKESYDELQKWIKTSYSQNNQ